MKIKSIIPAILLLLSTHLLTAQTLPFSIYLEPLTIAGMPGLQSYAFAQDNGKWLLLGGRIDGLHKSMGMGMMGPPFPTSGNNYNFIVVDPITQQKWTTSISSLPVDIKEQLSSTNTQYYQDGNYLYVIGGYGYQTAAGEHKTFDKITAIDVPAAINAVINGTTVAPYIRQISDPDLKITGGQLEKIYDTYYLAGGQDFDGTYHMMSGMGMFTQTYTNQIKKFNISDNGTTITLTHLPSFTDSVNLHRRDYNMVPQIMPNGEEGLTAFSGVFQTTADIPYLNCVNIDSNGYTPNNAFTQYYNHYQCANFPLYSASANEMYTVFFGGIAQYYDNAGTLVQDNNVPFVKTIACVKRDGMGMMNEYKLPVEMPALLGAGSEFIPVTSLDYYPNLVLKYDQLMHDTTLVGYVVGGITSPSANVFTSGMMGSNGTTATSTIYKVHLVKNNGATGILTSSENPFRLQIYPNPTNGTVTLLFHLEQQQPVTITVSNQEGKVLSQQKEILLPAGNHKQSLPMPASLSDGIYYISVASGELIATQKLMLRK